MATRTPSLHDNLGFLSSLRAARQSNDLPGTVHFMYTVVAAYFHSQEGYILQVTGNTPDTIYMELKQIIPGHNFPPEWTERQIFLVECKPPTSEFPVELDDNTLFHTRSGMSLLDVRHYCYRQESEILHIQWNSSVAVLVSSMWRLSIVSFRLMDGIKAHGWG
ncbi:hypothetical protein N7467_006485 [Penicillium canescens]|nr:hypothetical protein N7467_006485 [Penicillium canescens]